MWCVPAYGPRAIVSLLLALRDERRVAGAGEGVRGAGWVRSVDCGGESPLRGLLPPCRGGVAAPAGRIPRIDSQDILGPVPRTRVPTSGSLVPDRDEQRLRPDLVEDVAFPRPFAQDDLEFLRREHRLLVLQDILDRDPRTRGVDPCIHAVPLKQIGSDQIHEE